MPGAGRKATAGPGAGALPVLLAAVLLVPVGCSREPRFVPASADSTLAAAQDTFGEQVRVVRQEWARAEGGPEAARLSAALLLDDLRARFAAPAAGAAAAGAWEARARGLLDSLGIGAECAGAPGALAVNFFSRSDPSAGSWPWLFWDTGGTIEAQPVEGRGMSLVALATRGLAGAAADTAATEPPALAALFSRRAAGGSQPFVVTWLAAAGLEPTQALGSDSLGGVGSGAFQQDPRDGATWLVTRTWRSTPRFEECSTCPHVVHERRFRWELDGFRRVEDRVVPSPYAAFVDLVHALAAGDQDAALRRVTRPELVSAAQDAGWASAGGSWRAAPGQGRREDELVFYRGPRKAWRVGFERGPDGWLVDAIAPVARVID